MSKPISTSNNPPYSPPISGRSKVKRSGQSKKQLTLITCAVSNARACRSISRLVRGSRNDKPYSRSIDQYGMIVHGHSGMCCSQPNTRLPTSLRPAVWVFTSP
ncbi:hypothetical protein D3C79_1018110 [compost metagenome]